jgi:hypothetical protein
MPTIKLNSGGSAVVLKNGKPSCECCGGTETYYWYETFTGPTYSRCYGASLKGEQTFTNPFNMPATITITGYVDDDILINGAVYEPASPAYTHPLCPSLNLSHYFTPYTAVVGPYEETVIGYNDNHRGDWGINITITYTTL